MRILRLWFLYAFVGFVTVVAASASSVVEPKVEADSPTGWGSKFTSGLSGASWLATALAWHLVHDPAADVIFANRALTVCLFGAILLTLTSWVWIGYDLRKR